MPTIHITLPDEVSKDNSLNLDHGGQDDTFNDVNSTRREGIARRFASNYHFIITSNNSNEVMLIYSFIKSMLIQFIDQFELIGLQQCVLGGSDLQHIADMMPPNTFARGLSLSFSYDLAVQELFDKDQTQDILFGTV